MPLYRIVIPAYIQEIHAPNEEDALEEFWWEYDYAQSFDSDWGEPTIEVIPSTEKSSGQKEARHPKPL